MKSALAARLVTAPTVFVLQHGFAHANHAGPGERAAEFGAQRPVGVRAVELANGFARLAAHSRRVPMFVPPWNRYDPDIAPALAEVGIRTVSAFGVSRPLAARVVEANCHCDIISWKTTRGFKGVSKSVAMIVEHLAARRSGEIDATEATGVLSHHLVHDDGCWAFLEALFRLTRSHPGSCWLSPAQLIGGASV
jgi:predicted deacetylase